MNNLQLGLAIFGAVLLAAVIAHGAWTSRKSLPKQAEPEATRDAENAYLGDGPSERVEPSMDEIDQVGSLPADEFKSLPSLR